jgi:zinc/manganese transport system ATP-binding protein
VSAPAIVLDHAAVSLGRRVVWNDVSLTIAQGDFIAVLGPNGAGKTTLFKAILGLLPLERGSISVLGEPVHRGNPRIGYLAQRRSFDADLRIRGWDLVRLGLDGSRWGVSLPLLSAERRRLEARKVDDVIEVVGAAAYAGRAVGELSGGEQQRLLIAQALVSEPRILLLDEPLDSLDPSNQQGVAALVHRICVERGVTVLLIAHDVNTILPYLDGVIYVAQGRSLAGPVDEVITTASLSRLYGAPIEVLHTADGRLVVIGQPESVTYHFKSA